MDKIVDFINVNRDRYVDELKEYLAIPSISALPQHADDVRRCAEWTRDEMRRIGLQNVRLEETPGPSHRLRRVARRRGRADDPLLRPLRRAAGRSGQPVDLAAVRGDDSRRRDLRARLGRRQGPGVHALQGGRGAHQAARPPAGQHEVPARGRRGSRQRQPRRLHQRPQGAAEGRRRRHQRLADVRSRHPVDLLRPARPRLLPDRSARHEVATCTRDRSAAPSPTRRWCWRRSSRR